MEPLATPLHLTIGFAAGIVLGAAAGLIGVGGGEFRIPVLLYLLRRDVKAAAAANLVVGLLTVTLSLIRRWGHQRLSVDEILIAAALAGASIVGAVVGARYAHRFATARLLRVVVVYLLAVGTWMIVESLSHIHMATVTPHGPARVACAIVVGFAVACMSAALGVAGGEMRIPALIYVFAYDVKVAGTISLFASIPTVAGGALTYRRFGYLSGEPLLIAITMGVGSIVGVLLGTAMFPGMNAHVLTGLLGAVLLVAAAALIHPSFRREAVTR